MINYKQPGKAMTFTAPLGGVVSGTAYFIGALLVVATNSADADDEFVGLVEGVFTLPKATGATWSEGQILYWDLDNDKATTLHASTTRRIGVAAADALTGDTTGTVRLDGVSTSDDAAETVADSAVAPAFVDTGTPVLIAHTFADAATATYVFENEEKLEIIDAWCIKDAAGAANTIQITDSADAAITNAMAFAVDKTVTHAGTIDKAKRVLAAGAGYKVVNTRAAGSSAGQLFILAIKRA